MIKSLLFWIIKDFHETFIYNVFKDFVFPLFLALVSGFLAWYFFFRQIMNERQKNTESKLTELRNKLTYFAMITHNSIENAKGQNSYLKLVIADFDREGINLIYWRKYPTYDLKIIAEKIDIESYLLSYLNFYDGKDKIQNLNDFKSIIDSCGVINEIFEMSNNDLKSKFEFDTKIKTEYTTILTECAKLFGESLYKHKTENNPLFKDLFNIHNNSQIIQSCPVEQIMKVQHEVFVIPTLNLLDSWHRDRIEFDNYTGELWIKVKEASDIFNNLITEAFRLRSMFAENYVYINRLILKLENSSQKLRDDFMK